MSSILSAILITLSLMIPYRNPSPSATDPEKLKDQIRAEFARQQGVFALAYKNIQTGEELLINEKMDFHAASTMKTPVLIEAYKQAASGKFKITEPILVKNEFKSIVDGSPFSLNAADDSDAELYTKMGTKLAIYDLCIS